MKHNTPESLKLRKIRQRLEIQKENTTEETTRNKLDDMAKLLLERLAQYHHPTQDYAIVF